MVRSGYKWGQLTITIVAFVFTVTIAFVLYKTTPVWDSVPLMLIVVGFVAFAFYLLVIFFQRSPIVILDEEFITVKYPFGTKTYDWLSVKDVFFSRKEYYSILLILGQTLEATFICFENGEKLILWQDMYSNLSQLRSFISAKTLGKIRDPSPNISSKSLALINRRRYAGNVYTSFNTIFLFAITIIMSCLIIYKPENGPTVFFPLGMILFLYLLFGSQMSYFIIDNGYLFIKNHYFPWFYKQIKLIDIAEVDIETPYRRSTSLRIVTRDFNSTIYGGGSLRNRNWNELISDFKSIGVPVRDDRIGF